MLRFHGNAEGSRGALGCQSDGENRLPRKTAGGRPCWGSRGNGGSPGGSRGGGEGGRAPSGRQMSRKRTNTLCEYQGSVLTRRERKLPKSSCGQLSPGAARRWTWGRGVKGRFCLNREARNGPSSGVGGGGEGSPLPLLCAPHRPPGPSAPP